MSRHFLGIGIALWCLCLCLGGAAAMAQAVNAFTYRGGGQGRVTFDHAMHAAQGYVCAACHTGFGSSGAQLFQTQKQGLIPLADHSSNRQCFACHNGVIAVDGCVQCHTN